jgi:hypothetical protein
MLCRHAAPGVAEILAESRPEGAGRAIEVRYGARGP